MTTLRCVESFAFSDHKNGVERVIRAGDLVDAKDAVVKGREQWFENVETTVERVTNRNYEQATAAPGEKRAVTVPEADEADLDALRSKAEAAGVKVDKRWGADRLYEEIAAATKASPS